MNEGSATPRALIHSNTVTIWLLPGWMITGTSRAFIPAITWTVDKILYQKSSLVNAVYITHMQAEFFDGTSYPLKPVLKSFWHLIISIYMATRYRLLTDYPDRFKYLESQLFPIRLMASFHGRRVFDLPFFEPAHVAIGVSSTSFLRSGSVTELFWLIQSLALSSILSRV